jgi:vacuolar protein-sorting-associated protein 4
MSFNAQQHLDRAIKLVQDAMTADSEERYNDAFNLYMQSFNWFQLFFKYQKNPKMAEAIRDKVNQYMTRAEELQKHLKVDVPSKKKTATCDADGDLRGALENSILREKPNVKWDDVAGLETAKEALKEAVILPTKFPHLFEDLKPWRGILLYGPPGTGKSYLAKAVATEAAATFFSVSASDLVSKWHGESERLVRNLFEMARESKPSIIFIDEVDSMCSARGAGNESDATSRMKTEFMVQLQGVGKEQEGILVLGATNLPWSLDQAIRRRFEKRIYIPLPSKEARRSMFKMNVGKARCILTEDDYRQLAELTEHYSGSDISIVVRDALLQPVRRVQTSTHFRRVSGPSPENRSIIVDDLWEPCSGSVEGAIEKTWGEIDGKKLHAPSATMRDFIRSIASVKPSVSPTDVIQHAKWTEEFGIE